MSVSATLERSGTTLEPGGALTVSLTVGNDGDLVDEYRFRVVGSLAGWATVEPATVSVYPGSSAAVTVLFRAPRSWKVPAGDVPYGVQVLPAQHPHDTVVVEGVVEVLPFWDTSAELVPRTSEGRAGGRHRVAVDNRGNATIAVQLVAKDPEERLQLVLGPSTLRIAPGTVQSADLRVRPRRRAWRGTERAHPFTVEVRPDGSPGTVLAGTHRQEPLLPGWSPRLLKYLVVLALLAALAVAAVVAAQSVVRPVAGFLRDCRDGILAGDPGVCLGAAPQQGQDAQDQDAQDQDAQEQDGGGQDGGGQPAEVTADLRSRAAPEQDELEQDTFTAEESLVFTRLVLSASEGDTGVFRLTRDGTPISQNLALEQFSGEEQAFDVAIGMAEGQELALDLQCTGVDEAFLELTDACEVTAELEGVTQGG